MDVNDLLTALNGVLDLGDTLDNNGIGISAMTNWQHTTRELCKMELGSFLLYVGAGGGFFNDGQAGLVNLLLSDKYGQIPSWQMKSVADELCKIPYLALNCKGGTHFPGGRPMTNGMVLPPGTRNQDMCQRGTRRTCSPGTPCCAKARSAGRRQGESAWNCSNRGRFRDRSARPYRPSPFSADAQCFRETRSDSCSPSGRRNPASAHGTNATSPARSAQALA